MRTALFTLLAASLFAQDVPVTPTPLEPGLYAVFNTAMGSFTARLFEEKAPVTV